MSDYAVGIDEARERLDVIEDYDDGGGPRPCVHTFRSGAIGLLGAHWGVEEAIAAMREYGVEESGLDAQAMGHGLVIIDKTGPVFFATRQEVSA